MTDLTDEELEQELAEAGVATIEDFEVLVQLLKLKNPNEAQRLERHKTTLRVLNALRQGLAE